jgi:predicted ATPase/class 3 adenylate cyclase
VSATPQEKRVAIPTGTVTFAFTDIEGSTARWERYRAAMQDAVRRHDALMRAAIAARDGVVFKTVGDAFCAAFARPEDAIAAMLDSQHALAAEDFSAIDGLPVRAAIHTGTADERDGDYFGPAVNRVARLLAIGHGGQVLVSGVTADLVQSELPPQASLRDLGEHRLRDLARSEHVFQLVAPELTAEFPALRSLDTFPNNLPLQLKSFVGREREIAEVASLIQTHRLVTLVGSGGVGKTRASLQVAANLLDGSGDGVWFIELAPLSDGDYIPTTVAHTLNLTLSAEGDPIVNLVNALKMTRMLLVFDNCEHLVDAASRTIVAILRGCPHVKILASSRQGLGLDGEETYRMPSLDVVPESDRLDARQALRSPAISLFVERAFSADKGFRITDENATTIADICRRLDGIPLAIELAASRTKMFAPNQIHAKLDERFRMLTGGSRDVLPRQQTLRAMIDWSHDLLDDRERVVFRRLGIFVNGFTSEGALSVAGDAELEEFELFDVLGSLVDKSLVLAEAQADAVRYRLLESTRAYAREKLESAGETELAATRHLHYLHDRFADLWLKKERTARTAEIHEALAAELDDLRYALDGSVSRSGIIEGAELLSFFEGYWTQLGLDAEGIRRCEQYLAVLPASESRLRSLLGAYRALLLSHLWQGASFRVATEAVAHGRSSGDAGALGVALRVLANAASRVRRFDDAEAALAEAEAIPNASEHLRIHLLSDRAILSDFLGDYEAAVRVNEQLRTVQHALGNVQSETHATLNLAEAEHARGNTKRALEIAHDLVPRLRAGKNKTVLDNALNNLAGYLIAVDDLPVAISVARECVSRRATSEPGLVSVGIAIEHLALAYALGGDLARAARQEGYSNTLFVRNAYERENTETKTYDRLMTLLRVGLAPDVLEQLLAEGAALAPEAALALALADGEA